MNADKASDRGQISAALISLGAFGVVFTLWQAPALSGLLYPFRLFVTLVHEMGHGVAAVLTGGEFRSLQVMGNGAGLAATAGGSRFVILQAGYLGATLFGGVLLILANRVRSPRPLAGLMGMVVGGAALALGEDWGTRLLGLLTGLLLVALARWGAAWVNAFALNVLAMMVGLNAVMDIWGLLGSLRVTVSGTPNDALAMQELTGIPAAVWGLWWIAVSVGTLALCVYLTFVRRGEDGRED
jgi:hypothetical protein